MAPGTTHRFSPMKKLSTTDLCKSSALALVIVAITLPSFNMATGSNTPEEQKHISDSFDVQTSNSHRHKAVEHKDSLDDPRFHNRNAVRIVLKPSGGRSPKAIYRTLKRRFEPRFGQRIHSYDDYKPLSSRRAFSAWAGKRSGKHMTDDITSDIPNAEIETSTPEELLAPSEFKHSAQEVSESKDQFYMGSVLFS